MPLLRVQLTIPEPSLRPAAADLKMACRDEKQTLLEQFAQATTCRGCLGYLEMPVVFSCGYVCCIHCKEVLEEETEGPDLGCPRCGCLTPKASVRLHSHMEVLVLTITELQDRLRDLLHKGPRVHSFRDVTLDAATASSHLVISRDLKTLRVKEGGAGSLESVLGSPSFTSGRHYWEVDVRGAEEWAVGACRESADWQLCPGLRVGGGFWAVGHSQGEYWAYLGIPAKLSLNTRVERVGVFLDLRFHVVSFYGLEGEGQEREAVHMYTFRGVCTDREPLQPFFAIEDGTGVLRICSVPEAEAGRQEP